MLSIVSIFPTDNSTNVQLDPVFSVKFNSEIDTDTINDGSLVVAKFGTVVVELDLSDAGIGTQTIEKILSGDVTIDPDDNTKILFTPSETLELGTTYKVLVSDNIANVDGDTLASIYTVSFTTTNSSQVFEEQTSTNLLDNNANIGDTRFMVVRVTPTPNKRITNFSQETQFVITFNYDVDADTVQDAVSISYEEILDDDEGVFEDPTITVSGSKVTIQPNYTAAVPTEVLIKVSLAGTLKDINGRFIEAQDFYFVSNISPFYVPLKLFKLRAGQLISNISDLTLISLIHYYSIYVDQISQKLSPALPEPIKQGFAFYAVLDQLLSTTRQAPANSIKKGLADFTLEIDNKTQADIYNRCVLETKKSLEAIRLYIATIRGKNIFVKSGLNIDYPANVGRLPYYESGGGYKLQRTSVLKSRRAKWIDM